MEVTKPYDTVMGEPIRALVITEKLYRDQHGVAERLMQCFVEATKTFIENPELAEKYVREAMFKGQITSEDYRDAMSNAAFTYDISAEHVQITTDAMMKYGVGKMVKPPVAKDWVKLDLLAEAKKALKIE